MPLVHAYNQTVADGTATSVVRPSDWNSAHNQIMSFGGNTIGASSISGTNIVFQGGNNVTISGVQGAGVATIILSGANTTPQTTQPVAFSASGGSSLFSTLGFSNQGNDVTFSNSGGSVVMVHGLQATSATSNITSNAFPSANTTKFAGTGTTFAGTNISATLGLNSAGLNLVLSGPSTAAFLTTAAQSAHSHNFATTTTVGSQIVVGTANSIGATIGVPGFITTYVAQTTQTQPAGNIAGVGTTFAGTNITATLGMNSNGLALSLSGPAAGANTGAGSGTSATNATFTLNSNGLAFNGSGYAGTGTTFAGTNISATMGHNSNGLALSLSGPTGGGGAGNIVQIGTTGTTGTAFSSASGTVQINGSNNITVSQNNSNQIIISGPSLTQYLTTARGSTDAIGLNSALTANGLSVTANSSGLSINVPAWLTTAANSSHSHNFATTTTGGSNIVVGTANSVGATIGVPNFITTYVAQTVQTQASGIIAGVGTTFAGTNISATVGLNSAGLNLALSAAAGGGAGDGVNIVQLGTVGTTGTAFSASTGTVFLNGSNNITVSQNNSNQIIISGPTLTQYLTTARGSTDAIGLNTAVTNATVTINSSGFSFNGAGYAGTSTTFAGTGIAGSMTFNSAGLNLALSRSAGSETIFATGANTIAGTATSLSFSNDQYIFSGAGILSVGMSSNTIVLSVPAGGGGGGIPGIADQNASTLTNGTLVFANSNGVSFGLNGSTMTASVAAGGGGGITLAEFEPVPLFSSTGLSLAQNSLYINTLIFPNNVSAKYMIMGMVMTAGSSSSTPVTNSTATTGSSTSASAGQTLNFYFFTDGTGGMESNLYTFDNAIMTMSTQISWSQTNSNTTTGTQSIGSTVGYTYGVPILISGTVSSVNAASSVTTWGTSTSAYTGTSTFSTNGTSTSGWPGGTATNSAWGSTWNGSKIIHVPLLTSFSAGEYWLGIMRSSTTTGFAVAGTQSFLIQSFTSYDSNSRWAPFGYATNAMSQISHPAGLANGMFSTSYNSTSNYGGGFGSAGAIAKPMIFGSTGTATSGTLSRFYNRFVGEPI